MSTQMNVFVVYGIKLPYTEALEAFIERNEKELNKDLDIVKDGMGGEYIIMGHILYNSGDVYSGNTNDGLTEVDINKIDSEIKIKVNRGLKKHFSHSRGRYLFENPLRLWIFTHYT